MKNLALTSVLLLLFCIIASAQTIPADSLYLGKTPPGNVPIVFQLPVSNGLMPVERITISSDGKEIYYSEINNWPATNKRIKCFKYINNSWLGPFIAFEGYMCPALSVNDSVIYMQKEINNVTCTYFSIKNNTGWSTPARLLSTNLQTHYFQETQLKNFYLASNPNGNSDICKLVIHNSDTLVQSLGNPINTPAIENDFFIARDESYIIVFRLSAPFNLFISYNKGNGKWTNPKSLGININTSVYECCPFVTNDNKYLFFTRGYTTYSTYWVKVDALIDSLQHTNFDPYVNNNITDQTDSIGQLFNFTIPDSSFIDDDGNNSLVFAAKLYNGNPLPSWLSFDSISHHFYGTPDTIQSLNIKVTATDTAGSSTFDVFSLDVVDQNAINQFDLKNLSIYPNPLKDKVNISFGNKSYNSIVVKIADINGKSIFSRSCHQLPEITADLSGNPSGIYILSICIDGKLLHRKICIE